MVSLETDVVPKPEVYGEDLVEGQMWETLEDKPQGDLESQDQVRELGFHFKEVCFRMNIVKVLRLAQEILMLETD